MSREMKDSGIKWIGEIPVDWNISKHKWVMTKIKEICGKYNGEDIISLTMKGVIKRDMVNPSGKMPATFDGYQRVKEGNLLLCLFDIDVTPRCTGLIRDAGLTSPDYSHFEMRSNNHAPFYNYLLQTIDDRKDFLHLSKNLRSSLTKSDFGNINTIIPPIGEQEIITKFLDNTIPKINHLIERTREIMNEYQSLKHSIIVEAVTVGLDENVEMKDSGIRWIKYIPKHWNVNFAKYEIQKLSRERKINGNTVICSNSGYSKLLSDGSTGLVSLSQHDYQGVEVGDLLIHGMDTWHGAIAISQDEGDCTSVVHVCDSKNNKMYLAYYLKVLAILKVYKIISNGVRQDTSDFRSWKKVGRIQIVLPPLEEQNKIANSIDEKVKNINMLIQQKEELISELEVYKKSLIFDYVTGKKEVSEERRKSIEIYKETICTRY